MAAGVHGEETVTGKEKKQTAMIGNALAVLRARYLKKDQDGKITETPEEMFQRVTDVIAEVEKLYGLSDNAIDAVREEFYEMMTSGKFMPNSPTLMNAGRSMGMLSACFVLPVEDSIDGIFSSIKHTAMIQKAGGGTGFSFSRLRPRGDIVSSSGGTTSGPLSFLRVFSEATNAIQQGAFRRGANMGMMRIDHPDIIEFIRAKEDLTELTNFNLSISLTDEFMEKLRRDPKQEHVVCNPRTRKCFPLAKEGDGVWAVGEVFDLIVHKAWKSGEPGVVFIDRINATNPTPRLGEIEATNPCGEQPLLPFESCNLGSINLAAFVEEVAGKPTFNNDAYRKAIQIATRFLDNVIDANQYPIPEINRMTKGNRKIGLGLMGFADALYALGIPYNSEAGLEFAEERMKFLNDESHSASQLLAKERSVFPNWHGSRWEEQGIPMRNACTTTLAPTGTISIIANCSGGIEPLFSLAFHRNILDGQRLTEVNDVFARVAKKRGFYSEALIEKIAAAGSLRDLDGVPEDIKRVFVTARDISPEWHVRMQAVFQKYCDASISKTTNFPHDATEEEVRDIYLQAYDLGCKGVTVYRDGCRENQPMELAKKKKEEAPVRPGIFITAASDPDTIIRPMRLPEIMSAISLKQVTPFGNMHVKIVVDPKTGREREIFAQLGKGGDVACSDLEAICRMISLYLRVNGSLVDIINQLDGIGSSLTIPTKDGRISSLADGLAKALLKYLEAKKISGLKALLLGEADLTTVHNGLKSMGLGGNGDEGVANGSFKVKCPECAAALIFEEGCTKCLSCGYSKC